MQFATEPSASITQLTVNLQWTVMRRKLLAFTFWSPGDKRTHSSELRNLLSSQRVLWGEMTTWRNLRNPITFRSWNYEFLGKSFHFNDSFLLVRTVITFYSPLCAFDKPQQQYWATPTSGFSPLEKLWNTYSEISRVPIVSSNYPLILVCNNELGGEKKRNY